MLLKDFIFPLLPTGGHYAMRAIDTQLQQGASGAKLNHLPNTFQRRSEFSLYDVMPVWLLLLVYYIYIIYLSGNDI